MFYSWVFQPVGQIIPSPHCFLLNGILGILSLHSQG